MRQFKKKAKPTIQVTVMRITFTVMLADSTLKIANRAIAETTQDKMNRKITKDGRQQVFFHFFLPRKQVLLLELTYNVMTGE